MSIPQLVVIVSYLVIAAMACRNIGAHLLWQIPESILVQQEILERFISDCHGLSVHSAQTQISSKFIKYPRAVPPRRSFEKFQAAIPGPKVRDLGLATHHATCRICQQLICRIYAGYANLVMGYHVEWYHVMSWHPPGRSFASPTPWLSRLDTDCFHMAWL